MSLNNLAWDQAIIDDTTVLYNGIVLLLAFTQNRSPKPIGTGFIIGAFGKDAIGVTAAHNIQGIGDVQAPIKKHHATALPEFIKNGHPIDFDRKKVMAVCSENGKIEASIISWAVYDKNSDVAFFSLVPQKNDTTYFKSSFILDEHIPKLGDEIAVLGIGHMSVPIEERDGQGNESFQIQRQLILRKGTVTNLHKDGHVLCRGPCIETSIPVFSGMSGAPAMMLGKGGEPMKPFGLVSSDLEHDEKVKNDRTVAGSSIVALLNPIIKLNAVGQRKALLKLNSAFVIKNEKEF